MQQTQQDLKKKILHGELTLLCDVSIERLNECVESVWGVSGPKQMYNYIKQNMVTGNAWVAYDYDRDEPYVLVSTYLNSISAISKKEAAKLSQGYKPSPTAPVCGNCYYYHSDIEMAPGNYTRERNPICKMGLFKVVKSASCNFHEFKK